MSAEGLLHRYLDECPLDRDHPRRHARRGRSDRRRDLRSRDPHHRGAAELARPAEEHRAARAALRRARAGRRRDRARSEPGRARCKAAGGRLIVSPDTNSSRSRATVAAGLVSSPGYFTPSEAFAAIHAGAHALKLFPAEGATPAASEGAARRPSARHSDDRRSAGSSPTTCGRGSTPAPTGFGLGGGLYKPGQSAADTLDKARAYVAGTAAR